MKPTKKYIYNKNIIKKNIYTISNAIETLKKTKQANFNESLDIAINIKTKDKNANIKGFSFLPNITGKTFKIAVFLLNDEIKKHKIINADIILNEDDIKNIKKKNIKFNVILTTPKCVAKLAEISNILGPKGLMPNIKYGTITDNLNEYIENIKYKYVKYKTDKNNIIHAKIGMLNFEINKIKENIEKLIKDIKSTKSDNNRNIQIKKLVITTTMGPSLNININSLNI